MNARAGIPVVAVVGRPNVGKSSLVNRILGRREAIVQETPGVTRDRRGFVAEWDGRSFEIVDTGGLEPGRSGLEARVSEQAHVAIEAADLILFVVDATTGATRDDLVVADLLRRSGTPVILVANKVDSGADEASVADFYSLGLGDPKPVSALHGRASGDLLATVVDRLPTVAAEPDQEWASVGFVGRPNVGKSSLLNHLVGHERSLVDPTPGTTRDPVDALLPVSEDRALRVIDTAGMRRRTHITDEIEYYSFLRSRKTLDRADAVLVVVDASEGVTGLDQRLLELVIESGRAVVIALNKWDLVTSEPTDRERVQRDLKESLRFVGWAPVVRTSAHTRRGLDRIVPALEKAVDSHRRRVPTSLLNNLVRNAQEERVHPRVRGRAARILYAVQASVSPPEIVLFATAPLEQGYLRYLERKIREVEPFEGSPVAIKVRKRSRKDGHRPESGGPDV